jgi:F0F1-type ATP synthase membrane subunit c/vacuolar-type H+-ATPase subunit K
MTLQHIAAALTIGVTWVGATVSLWLIGKVWLESLGRNPEGSKAFFVPAILALALTEAVAIYGFVIAFMIINS